MKRRIATTLWAKVLALLVVLTAIGTISHRLRGDDDNNSKDPTLANAIDKTTKGRQIFRYDTFGDQAFWGDTLQLHQAIEGKNNGGIGLGVSPKTALAVGLKVDVDALPSNVREQLLRGAVNLDDPATTLLLLRANAVVGVTGVFNSSGTLQSMGIQCALCHL
jgi:hypothetical protein